MVKTAVQVGALTLKNPLIAASGTFGFGREMSEVFDLSQLGGLATKGITLHARLGNESPRVAETPCGMLNSVGLQNPGIDGFLRDELPQLTTYGCRIIANIAGNETSEYVTMVQLLDESPVDAIELNLSCPNVSRGCMSIGSEPELIREVVAACRAKTGKPLWVKLTPNVTAVEVCALAAEAAGADAISLINTLLGLAVDLNTRRPVLKNNTGGLSGPAVKPVALRMVHDVYRAVSIPVVGLGGIMSGRDALEMMLCGAAAVQVGTATLIRPRACLEILAEMIAEAEALALASLSEISGQLMLWQAAPANQSSEVCRHE